MNDFCLATYLNRPSKYNKSPYVGDILVGNDFKIVHMPAMDMGGKMVKGMTCLVSPIKDKKGSLIEDGATSGKYDKPRCQYVMKVVFCAEAENMYLGGVWIGAHPTLAENICQQIIQDKLHGHFASVTKIENQKKVENMRSDFCLVRNDTSLQELIEVKLVVDTDYDPDCIHDTNLQNLYCSYDKPYYRSALFPWGRSHQKGPDGEKVVSARAIKHLIELTKLVVEKTYKATMMFMVCRKDVFSFTPNNKSCPSFCKYLQLAKNSGVNILALQVSFDSSGQWTYEKELPIMYM